MFFSVGTGTLRQYCAGLISQLSVACAGACFVWLEPLTLRLTQPDAEVPLSMDEVSWLVAVVEVGSVIAPPISGHLSDRCGPKAVLLSVGPICLLGWLLVIFTRNVPLLYMIRVLQGVISGLVFTVAPIYTAEISSPNIRGAVSGTFQTFWYLGVLYSFLTGPYLSYNGYAYAALPLPIIFTILFFFCPETPYSYLMRGKPEKAKKSLAWFRGTENIDDEFRSMQESVSEDMDKESPWKTLFCTKNERKAFIVLQIVSISKFLTGMPTIISYASETFSQGSGHLNEKQMTIVLGVLLAGIGILSAFLSDSIGRRFLLLVSCFGCFVSHFLTGLYYFVHEKTEVIADPYVWCMYFGIVGYCFFSDIGLGPLMQTLQAEMFGSNTRGLAAGITETLAAGFSFVALKSYRPINDAYGVFLNFWIYSFVGLVGGILLLILFKETAGKTIGKMDEKKDEIELK